MFFFLLTACHTVMPTAAQLVPAELQAVIQKYDKLFSTPTELPPSRPCDHRIPLLEGAKVVNQRPSPPERSTRENHFGTPQV